MDELETYALRDFVPLEPEVYFRLFVRQNDQLWPLHLGLFALGCGILWSAYRGRHRLATTMLALVWVLVGDTFFWDLYAELNWAATYMGWAFFGQAALLVTFAWVGSPDANRPDAQIHGAALGLALCGLALYPFVAPLTGRSWTGSEFFGVAPAPTAIVTLGVLLTAASVRWALLLIPVIWLGVSGATAWAMDWPAGLVAPATALVALGLAVWSLTKPPTRRRD